MGTSRVHATSVGIWFDDTLPMVAKFWHVITRSYHVITRYYYVTTRPYHVITIYFHVITRSYHDHEILSWLRDLITWPRYLGKSCFMTDSRWRAQYENWQIWCILISTQRRKERWISICSVNPHVLLPTDWCATSPGAWLKTHCDVWHLPPCFLCAKMYIYDR